MQPVPTQKWNHPYIPVNSVWSIQRTNKPLTQNIKETVTMAKIHQLLPEYRMTTCRRSASYLTKV